MDGVEGNSAYEVAKANGYTGSELDWLQSLIGSKGDKGGQRGTRVTRVLMVPMVLMGKTVPMV